MVSRPHFLLLVQLCQALPSLTKASYYITFERKAARHVYWTTYRKQLVLVTLLDVEEHGQKYPIMKN